MKTCQGTVVGAKSSGGGDSDKDGWFLRCAVRFVSKFEVGSGIRAGGRQISRVEDAEVRGWNSGLGSI